MDPQLLGGTRFWRWILGFLHSGVLSGFTLWHTACGDNRVYVETARWGLQRMFFFLHQELIGFSSGGALPGSCGSRLLGFLCMSSPAEDVGVVMWCDNVAMEHLLAKFACVRRERSLSRMLFGLFTVICSELCDYFRPNSMGILVLLPRTSRLGCTRVAFYMFCLLRGIVSLLRDFQDFSKFEICWVQR